VPRIRKQRHRPGEQAIDNLNHDINSVKRDTERKRPRKINRYMTVRTMAIMMAMGRDPVMMRVHPLFPRLNPDGRHFRTIYQMFNMIY
jgi:hypothetical protein